MSKDFNINYEITNTYVDRIFKLSKSKVEKTVGKNNFNGGLTAKPNDMINKKVNGGENDSLYSLLNEIFMNTSELYRNIAVAAKTADKNTSQ